MSLALKIKNLRNSSADFCFIPFKNAFQPYLVLFLVSMSIYVNTLTHEVAFDDVSVMLKNEYVIKGIKGIPDILTHDSYYSYYKQMGVSNGLPGGRYRPLSQISFAIEQEFIGTIPDGVSNNQSWDINQNGVQDQIEDTNEDGIYNEYDFMIRGAGLRHLINVILYALLVLLIYHVLAFFLFPSAKDMVFFACILFSVHPLHTEVAANIKSRDELLSLIFILATMLFSFRYLKSGTKKHLFYVGLFMLLALLSKEYALLLFIILPITLFVFEPSKISFKEVNFWVLLLFTTIATVAFIWFFNSGTLIAVPLLFLYGGYYFAKTSKFPITKIVYLLGVSLITYLGLRFSATIHELKVESFKGDIIANPYMFASPTQELASKISVLLNYFKLFFLPSPLLADYSYDTIPYATFQSVSVWISLFLFFGLFLSAIFLVLKRSKGSFPLILILGFFIPVSNIFIDLGAVMGERLFFHASVGLCLLFSMLVFGLINKIPKSLTIFGQAIKISIIILLIIYSTLTIIRNPDWKNNSSLFLADVVKAPNNVNILSAAGTAYYQLAILPKNAAQSKYYAKKADSCFTKSISIFNGYFPAFMNKALNYVVLNELDSSLKYVDYAQKLIPGSQNAFGFKKSLSEKFTLHGIELFEKGNKIEGLKSLSNALKANKNNYRAWNNMGKALTIIGDLEKATLCFRSALQIEPKNSISIKGITVIDSLKQITIGRVSKK